MRWSKDGKARHADPLQAQRQSSGGRLGAGVRRNATVMRTRLSNFMARVSRFRRLRKVGVNTARLVRTGMRAITYSNTIMGVPCGLLKAQRQTAAAASAPGAGTGGQNLDLAMMAADGSKKGRADLAYDAHAPPVGEWAMALWERWNPFISMQSVINDAVGRIAKARNKWAVCYGPGAALVMTCARIKWTIVSATHLITDFGDHLNLLLDPKGCSDALFRGGAVVEMEADRSADAAAGRQRIGKRPLHGTDLATPQTQNQGQGLDCGPQRLPKVRHGQQTVPTDQSQEVCAVVT